MRGTRAKALRRAAYGPSSKWTKEGYFPNHPQSRSHTITKTYQIMIPKLTRVDEIGSTVAEQDIDMKILGKDGKMYCYINEPWQYNGELAADTERRRYQWAKRNWKCFKRVDLRRGW